MKTCGHVPHQQAAPLPDQCIVKLRPGSCNRHIHPMIHNECTLCLVGTSAICVTHSATSLSPQSFDKQWPICLAKTIYWRPWNGNGNVVRFEKKVSSGILKLCRASAVIATTLSFISASECKWRINKSILLHFVFYSSAINTNWKIPKINSVDNTYCVYLREFSTTCYSLNWHEYFSIRPRSLM